MLRFDSFSTAFFEEPEESSEEESEEEDDYYLSKRKAKRAGKVLKEKKVVPEPEPVPAVEEVDVNGEPKAAEENEDEDVHVSRRKQKAMAKSTTVSDAKAPGSDGWTQKEQNQLETAMISFPKGTPQRWQLIAECVPSKTLVSCISTRHLKYIMNWVIE